MIQASEKDSQPMTNHLPDTHQKNRPTIGFFNVDIGPEWALWPWQGMVDAARQYDVNLLSFIGKALRWPHEFQEQANVLYDLARGERLNGLIIWKAGLVMALTEPEVEEFCNQYGVPVVTVEGAVRGWPSVMYGNYHGMRLAVDHLIEVHRYRRIGFVGMLQHHVGFQERYRAYTDAMAAHGLPVDDKLAKPWFPDDVLLPPDAHVAEEVLSSWLQEALAARVEALVGVCDTSTIQILKVLQTLGVDVPGEVALVSFDAFTESRATTPPLTTVMPSWYELGYQALETLVGILAGKPAPEEITVSPQLMVRQSCGCPDPAVVQAAVGPKSVTEVKGNQAAFNQKEAAQAMVQAARVSKVENIYQHVERLVESFKTEVSGERTGIFLSELSSVLQRIMIAGGEITWWQEAISVLRAQALSWLDEREMSARAEDLWQQARVMIGKTAERVQTYHRLQAERRAGQLREMSQALITTFDIDELMDVLFERLPGLGIQSCYLSLYENPQTYHYPDPAPAWSRLVLAYNERGRVTLEPEGRRFRSDQLIPSKLWPQDRVYSFVVEPLHFQNDQIGFVMFEAEPRDGNIYETLRGEISSALQGALLLQARDKAEAELAQAYAEVEQQVAERTAELQREIKEREHAQAESLRLQQEIIEAQQQALQELSTPIIPVWEDVIIVPLIGSIDSLRARDITRALLAGISQYKAKVVIIDVTGVPLVDSGVATHLHKTIQAARLKGARTVITGITAAVAETIVDLGIDWSHFETMSDLQTGLRAVLTGSSPLR